MFDGNFLAQTNPKQKLNKARDVLVLEFWSDVLLLSMSGERIQGFDVRVLSPISLVRRILAATSRIWPVPP